MPVTTSEPIADSRAELFPEHLPPIATRLLGWFLIFIFTILVMAAVLIRVPESVRVPFVLMPEAGTSPLETPFQGTIEEVRVHEGLLIRKGDVLFTVRSQNLGILATQLETREHELAKLRDKLTILEEEMRNKLAAATAGLSELELRLTQTQAEIANAVEKNKVSAQIYSDSLAMKQNEIEQFSKEAEFRRSYRKVHQDVLRSFRPLYETGAISHLNFRNTELDAAKADLDLQLAEQGVEKIKLEMVRQKTDRRKQQMEEDLATSRLVSESERFKADQERLLKDKESLSVTLKEKRQATMHELTQTETFIASLQRDLEHSAGDLGSVTALFDGVVTFVHRKSPGVYVTRGQELCRIARADAALRAELAVPETIIARLETGQPVKLLYKAFPYERYGVQHGAIVWISPEAMTNGSDKSFPVFVRSREKTMILKGAGKPLQAGMQGEAVIRLGRRTMIEYLSEPVMRLRENMRDTDE